MTGGKRILLACPRGFCAGVRHAVEMVNTALQYYATPIYCLKELVHNNQVVQGLKRRGVLFVSDIGDVPRGGVVMFSAHGVPPHVRRAALKRKLRVLDATCPFVARLHTAVRSHVRQGCHVLLVGHKQHDEIIGVRGEAPAQVTVIGDENEANTVMVPDPQRVAAVTQTTLDTDETKKILSILAGRFPALRVASRSDICFATHHRQQAARDIARLADRLLVLGSLNSSNSNRLVEVCRKTGVRADLISKQSDLDEIDAASVRTMGLTAGASTPDRFVDDVIKRLREMGFSEVVEHVTVRENVHFPLPRALRIMSNSE